MRSMLNSQLRNGAFYAFFGSYEIFQEEEIGCSLRLTNLVSIAERLHVSPQSISLVPFKTTNLAGRQGNPALLQSLPPSRKLKYWVPQLM